METTPRTSPDHDPAQALLIQAKALMDANRTEQAVPLLLQASGLSPNDGLIPCHLSYAFSRLGDQKNALHYAEEAIKRNPDNEWAHRLRGHVFWMRRKYKEALKCAREAQRVDPDEPQVYRMQADLLMAQSRWKEAKQAAETMRTLAPDQAQPFILLARITMGHVMSKSGPRNTTAANKEAEGYVRQALAIAPDLPAAHSVLGEVLRAQHKSADALDAFYQASRLDPTARTVQQNLHNAVFTRFFLLPCVLLAFLLLPAQILFYRWGGVFAAGAGGALLGGLCGWGLMRRFGIVIAQAQKRFRVLPESQRMTLLALIGARNGVLVKSSATVVAMVCALPAFSLFFMESKSPQTYREAIRSLDRAFGVAPKQAAKRGEGRTVWPWRIQVVDVEEKMGKTIPPAPRSMGSSDSPWLVQARKPGKKLIAVHVRVRNQADTLFGMSGAYSSALLDASGTPISETLVSPYGSRVDNFSEQLTDSSFLSIKPNEEKDGYFLFVVGQNDRPALMEIISPTDTQEKAQWRLTP